MNVSIKVSLKFSTATKHRRLSALLCRLRSLTNKYIKLLWTDRGSLNKETMDRIPCKYLSYRHRSNCLKVALEAVVATRKAAKKTGIPTFMPVLKRSVRLSSLVCKIEKGKGAFDYVLKVSGLSSGNPIVVPFRSHRRLNHWLAMPGAEILQGATLSEDCACLWIKALDMNPRETGDVLGVDVGVCKLMSDSDGNHYGREMRSVMDVVHRRKPGSKGQKRARQTRKRFINRTVKQLPFERLKAIGLEDLKGIKTGRGTRGKQFRKWLAPWVVRQVHERIEFLARLNRVQVVSVDPRGTSRKCPMCEKDAKENRRGEFFHCVACHHQQDADTVGALNILARTREHLFLGSILSPNQKRTDRNISV